MWAVEQPDVDLFDVTQRSEMLAEVFALRRWWTLRSSPDFHTLGCALYQDGPRSSPFFRERVAASNALLRDRFGPALEVLRAFVAGQVGEPVYWRADLPLPGFHIFGAQSLTVDRSEAAGHFDMQFEFAGYESTSRMPVLSVTVPLQIPQGGASLDYWPVGWEEFTDLCQREGLDSVQGIQQAYPAHTVWYVEGRPCVQRGLPLHRIGASRSIGEGDYRITLQCHGVHDKDRWILYW